MRQISRNNYRHKEHQAGHGLAFEPRGEPRSDEDQAVCDGRNQMTTKACFSHCLKLLLYLFACVDLLFLLLLCNARTMAERAGE